MNRRDNDELRNIPTMKPARDEVVQRRQTPSRPPPSGSGGGKGFSFFLLLLVLASWAGLYLLWEQANTARSHLQDSEKRIASLESQLANTGDEMSQSDAAVRIRLKELDTEVRKLWDNVWKKSKDQLAAQAKSIKTLTQRSGDIKKQAGANAASLTGISAELDDITAQLDGLLASDKVSRQQQAQVREMADKLNDLARRLEQLDGRLRTNEEWVESINSFRQQVNQRLNMNANLRNEQPVLQ